MLAFLRRWRRRRAADRMRVPDALWRRVEAHLPFLDFLPPAARPRLRRLALEFVAEKEFHGAHGLDVSDEMQLSIALQAALPVLEIGLDAYAGWVGVIVYPGDFVIPRREIDEDGVVHEYDDEVLGEAWQGGPVLLSWFDEPDEAPAGVNVVLHEFAHKLDMANGAVDGFPALPAGMSRRAWADAFGPAYEDFCARVDRADDDPAYDGALPLDPYAAEDPSEFFAVASEAFFETPRALRDAYPAVYAQLRAFYRQDPCAGEAALHGEGAGLQ